MLGYGYPEESLRTGLAWQPAFIGVDSGSTDPGPYYLGSGTSFLRPLQVKRDLELALCAARERKIPLIIGTAGGCGAKPHLESFQEVLFEIARRRELHFRLALIHADIDPETVLAALNEGRIEPCGPAGELTPERITACTHIVGQMGTEPLIEALEGGADVVVAGRCCDTAIFAALPILNGFDTALALHLAKIAECGTLCARPAAANDALLCELGRDHFLVEPANPQRRCTPDSVAAHSLYEQPSPDCFYEPEGKVDLSHCSFEQAGPRSVQVAGTRLALPSKRSIKLEGALLRGFRSIAWPGLRSGRDRQSRRNRSERPRGPGQHACRHDRDRAVRPAFLRYGLDAVTGTRRAAGQPLPREVGIVIEAMAPTQELADTVLSLARSTALHQHFQGRKTTAGNLAFPFSPSDFCGGAVYEFSIYHLMEPARSDTLFPVTYEEW